MLFLHVLCRFLWTDQKTRPLEPLPIPPPPPPSTLPPRLLLSTCPSSKSLTLKNDLALTKQHGTVMGQDVDITTNFRYCACTNDNNDNDDQHIKSQWDKNNNISNSMNNSSGSGSNSNVARMMMTANSYPTMNIPLY